MKLKVGRKIKLVNDSGKHPSVKIGTLDSITENVLVIQMTNYKESITKADVIAPQELKAYVRKGKEWVLIDKEMIS
ncbi:MAG: hypothetical protein E7214_08225 [Clostridium sp.]|nr:hypothetical protein [Clostridium sp.]